MNKTYVVLAKCPEENPYSANQIEFATDVDSLKEKWELGKEFARFMYYNLDADFVDSMLKELSSLMRE